MSRAAALTAIARVIEEGGDVDVAYAFLTRIDPLLRRGARRRVRDAYVDALLSTQFKKGDEATRHVMRIAYLIVAGAPPEPPVTDDPSAITAAFEAARARRPPRAPSRIWWVTAVVSLLLTLSAAAGGVAIYRAFGPIRVRDASDRAAPPPRGAFATGGRLSPGNPAVTRAFAEELPDYLIRLDRIAKAREASAPAADLAKAEAALDEARRRVLDPEVQRGLGAGAAARLEQLLTAAREASLGLPGQPAAASSERLMEATGAFDDELAAAGLGYFVDGDVITDTRNGQRLVILYSFTVESVSLFTSSGVPVRALDLRRLDHLNWTHTLLGFTRPHLREALVLLDQVDEQLVTYVLPGLGAGEGIELFDEDEDGDAAAQRASSTVTGAPPSRAPARVAVEKRAGELVRSEYGATPGLDTGMAEKMGRLLSRRQALVLGWQKALAARRIVLQAPTRLRLDSDYVSSLDGMVPRAELAELVAIDDELGDAAFLNAYARLRDVLVDSVERHEVQHRLDYGRPSGLPMPRALETYVGPAPPHGGEAFRFPAQARAELSAYLAELSRDERTTRVNLTMIARFLFRQRSQGIAECYAALVIFEGLAAELSLPAETPFVRAGQIKRDAVADLYLALTALPPGDLRAAAGRLWEKLFAAKLPELRLVTSPSAGP
jgi:hypothetical protein